MAAPLLIIITKNSFAFGRNILQKKGYKAIVQIEMNHLFKAPWRPSWARCVPLNYNTTPASTTLEHSSSASVQLLPECEC